MEVVRFGVSFEASVGLLELHFKWDFRLFDDNLEW